MRKSPIFLCLALVLAVGAAVPKDKDAPTLAYDSSVGEPYQAVLSAPAGTSIAGYPPCRPGRGDDRCIQLYERRVQASLRYRQPAMGGPIEGPAAYPACSRLITDECVQLFDRSPRRPGRPAARRQPAPSAEADTPGL